MNEQHFIEALNDSLDRLASGQSLEDCLRSYPDIAEDLRILLELGQATSRARADRHEIAGMRLRLDVHINDLLEETKFRKPIFAFPQGAAVLLVASLLLVLVGFFIFLPRQPEFAGEINETPSNTPEMTQDTDMTAIPTIILSETATITAPPTETVSATATAILTETTIPSETPSPSPEPTACDVNPPDNWERYQVQAGDVLFNIAMQAGITLDNLMRVNCLEDTIIREGQILYILSSNNSDSLSTDTPITQAPSSDNDNTSIVSTQTSDTDSSIQASATDDTESDDEHDDEEDSEHDDEEDEESDS